MQYTKTYMAQRDSELTMLTHDTTYTLEHVYVNAGNTCLIKDLTITITHGEYVGIIGRSGSGKTTLLKLFAGLLHPSMQVEGTVSSVSVKSAMILQEPKNALNPLRTVKGDFNALKKINKKGIDMEYSLNLVGLASTPAIINARPYQLSGGMAQRVMVALSIASGARWIWADEISAALDRTYETCVMNALYHHTDTAVFVTHRLHVLQQFCTRVLVMDKGMIIFDGTVDALFASCHPDIKPLIHNSLQDYTTCS